MALKYIQDFKHIDEHVFLHEFISPVYHYRDAPIELPGWYFWDQYGDYNGPFNTKNEARELCKNYWNTF